MPPRSRRRRSMSGAHIANVKARICAGCEGYVRPEDSQCMSCGRIDTITFDSHAEMNRFGELRLREKLGQITALKRQVDFILLAEGGKVIGKYIADFEYYEGCERVVEDVKGGTANGYIDTPLSSWKRKHVEAQFGIKVEIVSR